MVSGNIESSRSCIGSCKDLARGESRDDNLFHARDGRRGLVGSSNILVIVYSETYFNNAALSTDDFVSELVREGRYQRRVRDAAREGELQLTETFVSWIGVVISTW